MSETDDTDVLLLIPPDFFLVHSSASDDSLLDSSRTVVHKPKSCTAQVIGKLVNQVHSLESRLESLELSSSITDTSVATFPRRKEWDSDSVASRERAYFTFPRRRRRKLRKDRSSDISFTSETVSAKQNIPRLKLNFEVASNNTKYSEVNETPSMDGDFSSIASTPSKKNDKLLLHEIDEFLTKVESYESPETKYALEESISAEEVIKATDYISQKLENIKPDDIKNKKSVPNEILNKYIYLAKSESGPSSQSPTDRSGPSSECRNQNAYSNKTNDDDNFKATQPPKPSITQNTRSPSTRRLNFSENKDIQSTSTPKKITTYTDSFKPSSNKIYDRASKVLEQYKSQSYRNTQNVTDCFGNKEEFKLPQMRPYVPDDSKERKLQNKLLDSVDTELLSLSDLWGDRMGGAERGGESSKLEEERMKREHCEALIQQLQKKLLEKQEKIAVAIKVDRAKDVALSKLREAWLRLTGSLDRAEERHRAALEKMMREVDNFKLVADEAQKKTDHFETELYKALDLAHDYQDKYKQLSMSMKEMEDKTEKALAAKDDVITCKDKEIDVLKENYETVMRLNKQSTDCVRNLEAALEKEQSDHSTTKQQLISVNNNLHSLSDELKLTQQERDLQRDKVKEERARGNMLERQLGEKQTQLAEMMKRCESLDNEAKTIRKHLELQKSELKSHYQKQLEEAVMGKLQEFQQQLDAAEREMEQQARGKESAIVETFNKQIGNIEEQHKLEINVLEEKHREEVKLYKLQLAQASEKIGLLEGKLDSYRRRRGEIASQLHGVMEQQWRQALAILTSATHDTHRGDSVTPLADCGRYAAAPAPAPAPARAQCPPPPPPPPRGHRRSSPLDRSDINFDALSDTELKQYVKMLLTKPPSLECSVDSTESRKPPAEEPTSDRPERGRRAAGKPPWKA